MRKGFAFVAALAVFADARALDAQWTSISKEFDSVDEHRYEVLLDLASITRTTQPHIRNATVKYVRTRPHSNDKDTHVA